jgi:CHAT domain-containing protein/Flp pilus assembly protein TadD
MNFWKRWFAKSNEEPTAPLSDREYEQLFNQVLQGVAANWDEQRLLKLLGDRCGDRQMVVWLRGYGDRLLSEPANPDLARLLVRLGEIGCGELGVVAQGIGVEIGNIPVERFVSEVEPREVNDGQNSEAEMLYQKGLAELQANKYQEALDYFDRAIAFKFNNFDVWSNRGVALQKLNRFDEAILSNQKAISLSLAKKLLNGNLKLDIERSKKASNSFESIKPNKHQAWCSDGFSLYKLGRYEEAIASYDIAISCNPYCLSAWNGKGLSLANLGRYEEAIISYDCAISTNPDDASAWNNKGLCLYDLGRYEEAIISYDHALTITKGNEWQSWINRGIVASKSDVRGKDALLKLFGKPLPQDMQNPALDLRGYHGQLASINEGFKYINQVIEPEGWGRLHQAIGIAHYFYGKTQPNPFPLWRKAIISYENALEALTPKFETAHLETLQNYIRVLLALRETEKAEGLLRKGSDFLEARLKEKSGENRERFERKFKAFFNELTVSLYIQQGKLTEALEIAEKDKNAFLRDGLLANTTEPSPAYSQMCAFLKQKPNTAIIYWHLSDNALTTFILASNASSEITLNLLPTPTTENATLTQRNQLTDWMTLWQEDYAKYGGKKTKSESQETKPEAKGETHPWRVQMEERLVNLKNILRVTDIESALADSPHCTQLLLIPHRDLHLYPLDSLFDPKYTIAYLPSIQVGIKLLNQPKPNYKRLLSIENPDSSITLEDGTTQNLPKLTAAEAESELICRIYGESTRRSKAETTLAEVTAQLTATTPQPHTIFHFTGHGYYDFFSPINSALALSGSDRLTLKAIGNLDLSSYQLACLCACETAIAGNQTITKEYIGIVSAFMYSGVANVVSTLWTVESISSALLMIEFHRLYVAGASADVALAAAKRWLRNITNEDLRKWYNQQIDKLPTNHSLIPWLRDRLDDLSQNDLDQISASIDLKPYNHPYHWSAFTITGL